MSPTSRGSASTTRPTCSTVGQTVKVQIIKINPETQRISLGMKQLESDPWEGVEAKYPVGSHIKGRVTNITDYGAFVELEDGIEGLVHVSEMSWTKKNVHPGKILSTSQEIDRRGARGRSGQAPHLARPQADAGQSVGGLRRQASAGTVVEGEVKNVTEFGLFIGLEGDVDGMVHLSDLDWHRSGERRSRTTRRATWSRPWCSTSIARRSASASASSSWQERSDGGGAGRTAQGRHGDLRGHRGAGQRHRGQDRRRPRPPPSSAADLARDRAEQRPERFAVGEKVDAKSPRSTRQAARSPSRSRRWRSPRRRKRWPSTARPTPAPRSATSSARR
jgi:small subunit ribosomal protein S1